ncbi:phage baseplate assembly protein V [Hoylesella loescheii]|uniref:phage baseplate assembly protein V n=1 Tax=Hoylesella loescheii TaxID=840 RepID=UPI0003811D66|nr:phage baseplate assembly protein V [Hoylesella loescheii]
MLHQGRLAVCGQRGQAFRSFGKRIGSVADASMGEFLVIDVTHDVGDDRFYGNSFRAIPSVARSLPVRDVGRSVAETQVARVIGNADPDGKGRVQVQMNWQTGNMRTGWIRVMTPDGGGSENVPANRGFVFIPEVGDHVLVGFRHGDPNRPYVMGSLFNGRTGVGGFAENHLKSIRTRSGHIIELDDDPSSLGITIKDNKGNSVHIDSAEDSIVVNAEKDITFNAAETFTVNAKNMKLNVEENAIENVGKDKVSTIGNKVSLEATEKEEEISNDSSINVGGLSSQTAGEIVQSATSGDAAITAEGKALLQGKDDARICKG